MHGMREARGMHGNRGPSDGATATGARRSVTYVADLLGVDPATVRRWCTAGHLTGAYQLLPGISPWQIPDQAVNAIRARLTPAGRAPGTETVA